MSRGQGPASVRDRSLEAPSLADLAVAASIAHPQRLVEEMHTCDVHLPLPVSHALYTHFIHDRRRDKGTKKDVLRFYTDGERFPLCRLDLDGLEMDDALLVDLISAHHNRLGHLSLANVSGISSQSMATLDARGIRLPMLKSLRATSTDVIAGGSRGRKRKLGTAGLEGRNVPVLGEEDLQGRAAESIQNVAVCTSEADKIPRLEDEEDSAPFPPLTARCPSVRQLNLSKEPRGPRRPDEEANPSGENPNELLHRLLEPLPHLQALELSHWTRVEDLRSLRPHTRSLTSLTLYDVPDLYKALDNICELTQLRLLDLSQCSRDSGNYPRPASCLYKLVTSLPHLSHLDISSTNLAAQPSQSDWPNKEGVGNLNSDIYALRFLPRQLEFLGLFNCDSASHYAAIPAKFVSGDACEDQVINALRAYSSRAGLLQAVLNESYQLYRFGNNNPLTRGCRHTEALHLVLQAMYDHLLDSTLQIAGSASLFYIIRKVQMNRDTKKRVVGALLSGMENHMEEQVMVRNCCLSLCQFEIPQEILFDYSRLAVLLVTVLQHHNGDSLTQRIVVFLLNSMACHVEGDQKIQVGSYGAIEMILEQIRRKLTLNVCDDVMEVGWSFLWNITDETPLNCKRFLEADGLTLFDQCFQAFTTERELVRNMMGLIGNIAEVDDLRPQLMKDPYINIFCKLLDRGTEESIEISYNSAGVLAHMASDGDAAWTEVEISREFVMQMIMQATSDWRLDTRRFINYRSFRPILRLIPQFHAYASQHWAVWALANLTTTDGCKYCAYVVEEGGETLLQDIVVHETALEATKDLARTVLDNISKWRSTPSRKSYLESIQRDLEIE